MGMEDKKLAIHADGIYKSFKDNGTIIPILKGLNLEVSCGETVAIMGRSGEGKSTLLHILGTLESPSRGSLSIAGQPVSSHNKNLIRNRHIGFVFQAFNLLEDFTALENILMPARIGRLSASPGSATYKHAMDLLQRVGISHRAHFLVKLLSGGERQRVAIARALCNNPDIILADEPTGNLDSRTAEGIHDLLLDFVRSSGKALVVVTHNEELASLCDKRYFLHNGCLENEEDYKQRNLLNAFENTVEHNDKVLVEQ
jgi:lipoprotein-releasing system ATP-binding protein